MNDINLAKQRINITIDQEVWIYFKKKGGNLSETVNQFLRQMMNIDGTELAREEKELEEELEKLKQDNREIYDKMMDINTLIIQARKKRIEEENLRTAELIKQGHSIKANNPLRFIE